MPPCVESPRPKLVSLALTAGGAATVEELQDALSTPTLTLYGVLRTLTERGLVEEVEGRYAVSSCFSGNGPS